MSYDTNWNKLPCYCDFPQIEEQINKPRNLERMLQIAEKLAEGLPHVRVDLYLLDDGEIKFGEMTFTSDSGACRWNPPEADLWVGEMFTLSRRKEKHKNEYAKNINHHSGLQHRSLAG